MRHSEIIDRFEQRGNFVTFHPRFAEAFGGIKEALLIGKLIYWSEYAVTEWMAKTLQQVELETGLTTNELRTCRARLEARGLLETKYDQSNHLLRFKLNIEELVKLWKEHLLNSQVPPEHLLNSQVPPVKFTDAARARHNGDLKEEEKKCASDDADPRSWHYRTGQKERPSSFGELAEFLQTRKLDKATAESEAEHFIAHFKSNGWRIGGRTPMQDWKSAAITWARNALRWQKNGNGTNGAQYPDDGNYLNGRAPADTVKTFKMVKPGQGR